MKFIPKLLLGITIIASSCNNEINKERGPKLSESQEAIQNLLTNYEVAKASAPNEMTKKT